MKNTALLLTAGAALLAGCTTPATSTGTTAPLSAQAPIAGSGTARFDWFEYRGADPLPQAGPGEYRNPILQGFYPDPSITRAGDDYYLVTSTFAYYPGLPVFHSRDLVNWTQIGNAIDRPGMLDFGTLGLSRGVFAPAIEHHEGTFYIANTCVDCGGNFVITATDPAGPWSDPAWLPDLEGGIDPSIYFDEDGSAWILNNGPPPGEPLYEGHRAIWIQRFDPETLTTSGERTLLVNGGVDISTKPVWIEGPHIYKVNGWYYLSAAEGGTAINHSQVVLRSRNVTGPYEPWENNPYLTQRDLPADRANPITSAGHADLVQLPDGTWWATFLAVRPYEGDFYNTGRETFLMPVDWSEGWPRMTGPGEAIPYVHARPNLPQQPDAPVPTSGAFTVRDEFDGPDLPFYWMMPRVPTEAWYELSDGALLLDPRPVSLGEAANPSFLARRQQHLNGSASTLLRFDPQGQAEAGLAAFQNEDYWYALGVAQGADGPVLRLRRRAGASDPQDGTVLASAPLDIEPGAPIELRVEASGDSYAFSYGVRPGEWQTLAADLDGKILSTRTAGGFVGVVFGPYAVSDAAVPPGAAGSAPITPPAGD